MTPTIDPLLKAALDRLAENGPTWHEDEKERWCEMFFGIVVMLYPGKPRRKSRAKNQEVEK